MLKTICDSPKLSELDAELNNIYQNMLGQPAIDRTVLAKEEAAWMHALVNRCADVKCIEAAYEERIAELSDKSLRAASPAAYAETRPFPAPAALIAEARAYLGKSCAGIWSNAAGFMPGFRTPKGFLPVTAPSAMVFVREKQGSRFAFLAKIGDRSCQFADVVVLPSPVTADTFLQCTYGDPPDSSSGFGMRKTGVKKLVAYWEIDGDNGTLTRQPLGVLGVESTVRCQQPETGD